MALSLYTGIMGSGKSYELVSQVVVPALRDGRRVVSNIEGLNLQALSDYLDLDLTDKLVLVSDESPLAPDFWYHPLTNPKAVTQPGDVVVLDEAWRMFPSGSKLDPAILEFFRKHRHYTASNGVACDIALAFQLFSDIHRALRGVAATTIETRKMTMLGRPKSYRVRIYEGARDPLQRSNQPASLLIRKYDPKIFPLYKSFAATAGVEKTNGRKASLLSNSLLSIWLPLTLIALVWGLWYSYRTFFSPLDSALEAEKKSQPSSAIAVASPLSSSRPSVASTATPSGLTASAKYVGYYVAYSGEVVYMFNQEGATRYATVRDFKRVISYPPFTSFELKDGSILSETYRPLPSTVNTQATNDARSTPSSSSGSGTPFSGR